MTKLWEDNKRYTFYRRYVDLCTRTGFSSVKIEGLDKLPSDGAVIIAPNHCAALMDPLLVLLTHRGPVGFGARADIFRKPKIAAILRWLRIVPLARERDGISEVAKDYEVFDEIVECIDHDVPFCMFSEGTHRAERGLLPIKKGIFRVAKMAVDRLGKRVYVVPMGLDYEYFFREMGRVCIRIGQPIEIGSYFDSLAGTPDNLIIKDLCEDLSQRLLALIGRIPERRHDRIGLRLVAGIVALPFFITCASCSFPIWLTGAILLHGMDDKAWTHTVYYVCRLLLPIFWPFQAAFAFFVNFYKDLLKDLHR